MAKKKSQPKPETPADPPAEAKLSKLINFVPMEVHRRDIKEAVYNPRVMQDEARADLSECIDHFGLVEPLVWNKRTGTLVSGHQRLKKLDREERTDNYKLYVAAIDVDEKTEKELNIALNNTNLTGDYDLSKLGEMFRTGEVDAKAAGFSPASIYQLFGDNACLEQPEAATRRSIVHRSMKRMALSFPQVVGLS